MLLKLLKSNKNHDFIDILTKILLKNQEIRVSCVLKVAEGPHAARGSHV
jgi:hypothetical protein